MTDQQKMAFVCGHLYGLAGTVRYQLDDDLRAELRTLAQLLATHETLK